MNYSAWYEKNYPFLTGHGLWLRGSEINTVPAAEFDRLGFRVLIARLSTYRDTADSFTHTLLYQIVRRIGGAYPDLAFLPPPRDAALFKRDNVPWLLGTTSRRSGRDFSVVAFSLSIVQELLNLRAMLETSGIPLRTSERMNDPAAPLVILGGASALFTSVLFNGDPLVDGIFIGEDAPAIERLFTLCRDGFGSRKPRQKVLEQLCAVPGFFLPEGKKETRVFQSRPLPAEQLLESGPVGYEEPCVGRGHLQISEGCACSCSFCAESFCRKPYREFDTPALVNAALRQKAAMGIDDLELYSFNFSMHRRFYELLWELSGIFPSLGLKSQRFDSFAHDPGLVKFLHAAGKTSITCGLEGISPRLRRYLRKDLDEKKLRESLKTLLASPLRELKIFILATGVEREEDYREFKDLLSFMREAAAGTGRPPRIIFSQTVMVRFPWTPLEFEDAPEPGLCASVVDRTGRLVSAASFEFRASSTPEEYWISQVLVRADDSRIGAALDRTLEKTGFVYYRELPESFLRQFRQDLAAAGVSPESLLRGFPPSERLKKPWRGLCTGVDERLLAAQWESGRKGLNGSRGKAEDAGQPAGSRDHGRAYSESGFREHLKQAARNAVPLHFHVAVGPALAGVPRKMRAVALARALMLAESRLVKGYRGCGSGRRNGSDWLIGDDSVSLLWEKSAALLLEERAGDPDFLRAVDETLNRWEKLEGLCVPGEQQTGTIEFSSPFDFDPAPYFREYSLKCTLRKSGNNETRFELTKDSLKKNVLSSCRSYRRENGGVLVTVSPGRRFDPEEFCRKAFKLPAEEEWVRIEMKAIH